jgi:hypothetical protein
MNAKKSAILAGPVSTCSTSKVAKTGLSQPQHTTQHTTTKMSRCHPTLHWLCPLSPWAVYRCPHQWRRGSLWSHARRLWSGLAARWLIRLFGAPNEDTSKNREIHQALALGGRRLMMRDNNQLGVGGRVWRDVGEEARGSCSVWGGGIQLFEVTNSAQKK